MRPIAIRLFENQKFGTTYGKGLRRSAVFNATAEVSEPYAKYLLDFESGPAWINHAKTDAQLGIARLFINQVERDEDVLWSWVKWYDKGTGDKEFVDGFAVFDPSTDLVMLSITDPKRNLESDWALPHAKPRQKPPTSADRVGPHARVADPPRKTLARGLQRIFAARCIDPT